MNIPAKLSLSKAPGTGHYLLRLDHRCFQVSELVYLVIQGMQNQASAEHIAHSVNARQLLKRTLTGADIEKIIAEKIAPLNLTEDNSEEKFDAAIKCRFILLRFKHIKPLLDVTRFLYFPWFFWPMLVVCAALSAHHANSLRGAAETAALAPASYPWLLLILGLVFLLHELGHAGAAYAKKIIPGEIGCGLYLIFPVFFANVSNIWGLAPRQRIIVNLAGIHAQLIANGVLIACHAATRNAAGQALLQQLFWLNSTTILLNLNPFLKFDGYWVYADFFDIPNLKQACLSCLVDIFRRLVRGRGAPLPPPSLLFYSIAYPLFFAWLWYAVLHYLAAFSVESWELLGQAWHGGYPHPDLPTALRLALTAFLVIHFSIVLFKKINAFFILKFHKK